MSPRNLTISCTALILVAVCVLAGCPTGPVQTNNPNPPLGSFLVSDQVTHQHLDVTPAGGSPVTVFITPGDNYVVTFQATSPSGIKTITLNGSGEAICHNNKLPFDEANQFTYFIPAQTINLSVQPGQQGYTQAVNPFFFFWSPGPPGEPALSGPTATAFTKCGSQIPLLGTTTYNGQATTYSGVSSAPVSVSVTTCFAGLASSPGQSCGN